MEKTVLDLDVGNPDKPEISVKVEFLMDSGNITSIMPAELLEKLGIESTIEQEFMLMGGRSTKRKKGTALFKFEGKTAVADVIFGEKGDCVILGSSTLEAMGLMLHRLNREIIPIFKGG